MTSECGKIEIRLKSQKCSKEWEFYGVKCSSVQLWKQVESLFDGKGKQTLLMRYESNDKLVMPYQELLSGTAVYVCRSPPIALIETDEQKTPMQLRCPQCSRRVRRLASPCCFLTLCEECYSRTGREGICPRCRSSSICETPPLVSKNSL